MNGHTTKDDLVQKIRNGQLAPVRTNRILDLSRKRILKRFPGCDKFVTKEQPLKKCSHCKGFSTTWFWYVSANAIGTSSDHKKRVFCFVFWNSKLKLTYFFDLCCFHDGNKECQRLLWKGGHKNWCQGRSFDDILKGRVRIGWIHLSWVAIFDRGGNSQALFFKHTRLSASKHCIAS